MTYRVRPFLAALFTDDTRNKAVAIDGHAVVYATEPNQARTLLADLTGNQDWLRPSRTTFMPMDTAQAYIPHVACIGRYPLADVSTGAEVKPA